MNYNSFFHSHFDYKFYYIQRVRGVKCYQKEAL